MFFTLTIKYKITSSSGLVAYGSIDLLTQNPKLSFEAFKNEHPEAFIICAEATKKFEPDLSSSVTAYINGILDNLNEEFKKGGGK